VLSSADAARTLIDLCDVEQLDPEIVNTAGNVRGRGVVARVHLALDRVPAFAGVSEDGMRGLISIAPHLDYIERAYDDAKYGRISADPHLEVTIPSLMDPSVAPENKHTMSISMQYAPYTLRHGQWDDAQRSAIGELVVKTLAQYAPDLPDSIIDGVVLTPADLERDYGLPEGSFDHAELGLDQILFMRPIPECARYATPIERLFLCGAGTHPGRALAGGSGRLAARAALAFART
jgi:phytoene dehydrogenase-like protein